MINIRRFADDEFNYDINIDVKSNTKDVDKVIQIFDKLEQSTNKYASRISNNFKNMLGSDATRVLEKRKYEMDKLLSSKHTGKTRTTRQSAIRSINDDAHKDLEKILNKGSSASVERVFSKGRASVKAFNSELSNTPDKFKNIDMSVGNLSHVIKSSLLVQLESLYKTMRRAFAWMGQAFVASGDYVESINLYTMSVGEYAKAGEEWARKINEALYLDTSEIYQYTGQFYNLTKGLGVTAKAADLMSRNLTQLSYDMSSYLNIDVSVANNKLMSAMSGQTKAVTSVGVAVQVASLQELAYSMGINKSVQSMTQAEKTYLRYIQIMKSTTQMQGDLGRTIITPTNAMRLLRTQMLLLARAVGQVLTPFIMKLIPYVMALTQVLKEAAEYWAGFFGYNIKDYLADASDVTQIADWFDEIGKSADDAAAKINRTLAPFDELNVVAKEGAGKDDSLSSILPELEKYLNGYDMLQYYTDKMKKKMEALKKPMKDLIKIAGVLIGVKAFGGFINMGKSLMSVFKNFDDVVKTMGGTVGTLALRFLDGYRYAKYFGENGLVALQAGIQNILGPWGNLAVSIGTTFAAFNTGFSAFGDYAEGAQTLGDALWDVGTKGGLLVGIAYAFAGPWAALATGIGLVVGAVDGYYTKLNEMKVHEAVFDGQGAKIETLAEYYVTLFDESKKYTDEIDKLSQKYQTLKAEEENAKLELEKYIETLELHGTTVATKSQLDELSTKYKNVKEAIMNTNNASNDYYTALIKNSAKSRGQNDEDTAKEIANYQARASAAQGYQLDYLEQERKLTEARFTGAITSAKYNEELDALKVTYGLISSASIDSAKAVDNFSKVFGNIDYGDIDKLPDTLTTVTDKYNETIDYFEEYKKNLETTNTEKNKFYQDVINTLDGEIARGNELDATQQKIYDDYTKHINDNNEKTQKSIEEVNKTIVGIQGSYKGFLSGVYADLVRNGADTSNEFKGVMDTLKGELQSLQNVDMSGTGEQIYKSMEQSIIGTGNLSLITKLRDAMKKVGVQGSQALMDYLTPTEQMKQDTKDKFSNLGVSAESGVGSGYNKSNTFIDAIEKSSEKSHNKFEQLEEINSPSKVYQRYGSGIVEGLALGISENKQALTAISNLATSLNAEMNKLNISFNGNGFEKSLDSLLAKLQTFSNKFSTGINNLLSSFTNSMNNVTIGSDNKIKYTKMPNIKIPRFEDGGYPDSASLFYMNENGVPEMLGNIGNKTAVVNNDQIITSMTNALVKALTEAKIGQQTPGTTVVNIGNRKVYEGIGTYVDSENDRYGTNYVSV